MACTTILKRVPVIRCVVAIATALFAWLPAPAWAATRTSITLAVQVATTRTHTPTGTVSDIAADERDIARLLSLYSAPEQILYVIDPATIVWLDELAATSAAQSAHDLRMAIDAHPHISSVMADAQLDRVIAGNQVDLAKLLLSWGTSGGMGDTSIYIPASQGLDQVTARALAQIPSVISALATSTGASGSGTLSGAQVVLRTTGLEQCFSMAPARAARCASSQARTVVGTGGFAITPRNWVAPPGTVAAITKAVLRTPGVTLSTAVPHETAAVNLAFATKPHRFTSRVRQAAARVSTQAQALTSLFPDSLEASRAKVAVATALSSAVPDAANARSLLASAEVNARVATDSILIRTHGRFTIAGSTTKIPLTIANESSREVTVALRLAGDTVARMRETTTAPVTVAPGARVTVPVDVQINGVGTVGASVSLLTSDGIPFGTNARITVTSTAYQSAARNVIWVAFAALLLLAGNNWRKRHRSGGHS